MKFVAKYRCSVCGAEVILIRSFDEINRGRSWQSWVERHGCTCVSCHGKSCHSRNHIDHMDQATAYAEYHCWPELIGDPDQIREANLIRCEVSHAVNRMLRFPEICYSVMTWFGRFLAEHVDAEWWLQRDNYRAALRWEESLVQYCNSRNIDLVKVYMKNLDREEKEKCADKIIPSYPVRTLYPAVYLQYSMQRERKKTLDKR